MFMNQNTCTFSVIVCTYNRDKYIYETLKKITENDYSYEKFEIILINNNSTDNTENECNRFRENYKDVQYKYFVEYNQGLSYARNRGISESKGDFLIFLDDDSFVDNGYLKKLEKNLREQSEALAFGGRITPLFESGETPAWISPWSYSFISAIDKGKKVVEFQNKSYPIGANMGFYKKCIEVTGDFNVNLGRTKKNLLGGEEKDIFNRFKKHNYKIYYFPDVHVHHVIPPNRTTREYIAKLGYGVGVSEYLRCRNIGGFTLFSRYVSEVIKWGATILLWVYYTIQGKKPKGDILVLFRRNVTKGLISKDKTI